ncbi:MAG: homocysteine S-methyltransferase family protein [Kiritimatiellae bacterium]|nr:homocysteine S-methyltransferase family protein [Kiritimatiellia bacterium]
MDLSPEILDGGMGTLLQERGLRAGETPEDWNVERPDDILAIHRAYVAAGAQVVYANTFGANRLKYHGKYELEKVIRGALEVANKVKVKGEGEQRKIKIALDIGPTGRLLKPVGDLDFDEAVAAFAETISIATSTVHLHLSPSPDLIVIETMGDLLELKAAVIAAKENCSLPIYATVALGEDGKLLTGGTPECVAALLESLGVDAYGFNCGLGPDRMLPFVERLAKISTKPIIVKPNAGLPRIENGRTVFSVGPDEFAGHVAKLVRAGASVVGGCCGTTPAHISRLKSQVHSSLASHVSRPAGAGDFRRKTKDLTVSSGTSVVMLQPHAGLIIGERINPTGKKLLKEAYAKGDTAYVLREAVKQVEAGARILDVNCGVPGLDESALLDATVASVQGVVTCPIQIDTADPAALERALRHVNGKPLVNSVNGKRESMDAVFPLVRTYGGAIVALCLDENGIPPTSEGRLAIARRILAEGAKYGFTKSDFIFDALTLAVSSDMNAALVTLETVKRLTDELGVNTVLGVSNVSFGLPNRPALNNAMYALAKRAGLSAAIANPAVIKDEIDPAAEDVLLGRDPNCARWIESNRVEGGSKGTTDPQRPCSALGDSNLSAAIRRGLRDDARASASAMLKGGVAPLEVIERGIVPALEEVGRGFEKGTVFLPQLLMAADAAGEAFGVVKGAMSSTSGLDQAEDLRRETKDANRPIVIATVKGDIHDIGKNIVRALLENYGFAVIDLGRDVPPEKIVETARTSNAMLVGLSALMTTTVGAMAETIRQLKAAGLGCRTVVGGAVVTQEYADSIGADFYAKDAMRTVRIAEALAKADEGRV